MAPVLSYFPFFGKAMDKKIFVTLRLEPSGRTFRLAVPRRWLYGVAGLLAFFVFSDLLFSVKFIKNTFEARLEANQTGMYASIPYDPTHLVSDLKEQMGVVMEQERRLRKLLGVVREKPLPGQAAPVEMDLSELGSASSLDERLAEIEKQAILQKNVFEKLSREYSLKLSYLEYVPRAFPVLGRISRGFGLKNDPFTGDVRHHRGVDIAAPYGTAVKAPAAGWVIFAGWEAGFGRLVILRHKKGYETYYGHLSSIAVKSGQKVTAGALLGRVGSSGYSTGPHLHYEVRQYSRALNPSRFLFADE
jgi:murein DD-endopeptidase MepM/ murein hydrolase activator NlpD